jgi:hypothetical protein
VSVKQLSTRTIYLPIWEVEYKGLFGWNRLLVSGLTENVENRRISQSIH